MPSKNKLTLLFNTPSICCKKLVTIIIQSECYCVCGLLVRGFLLAHISDKKSYVDTKYAKEYGSEENLILISHACSIYSKRICMCTTEDPYTVSEKKFIKCEHFLLSCEIFKRNNSKLLGILDTCT